jgi:hypothetical protein
MCYVVESQLELWKKTLKFQVFVMEWASERIEVKSLAGADTSPPGLLLLKIPHLEVT